MMKPSKHALNDKLLTMGCEYDELKRRKNNVGRFTLRRLDLWIAFSIIPSNAMYIQLETRCAENKN